MGITQHSVYIGTQDVFNATVRLIKQDINFVDLLDNVTLAANGSAGLPAGTLQAKG